MEPWICIVQGRSLLGLAFRILVSLDKEQKLYVRWNSLNTIFYTLCNSIASHVPYKNIVCNRLTMPTANLRQPPPPPQTEQTQPYCS